MVLSKKLIILIFIATCFVSCSETKQVVQGGQDSGGGNTSVSTAKEIELVISQIDNDLDLIISELNNYILALDQELAELVKLTDLKSLELKTTNDCKDDKSSALICLDPSAFIRLPKHSLHEEIIIAAINKYLKLSSIDDLSVSKTEVLVRREINSIFHKIYLESYYNLELNFVLKEFIKKFEKMQSAAADNIDLDVLCERVSNVYLSMGEVESFYKADSALKEEWRINFSQIKGLASNLYSTGCAKTNMVIDMSKYRAFEKKLEDALQSIPR